MYALCDQAAAHSNKLLDRCFIAKTVSGYLVVLAEKAAAGTTREKNGAGAAGAADRGFFAEVCTVGTDAADGCFAAYTAFTGITINSAIAGTKLAGIVSRQIMCCHVFHRVIVPSL